jgi:hypothetical protein
MMLTAPLPLPAPFLQMYDDTDAASLSDVDPFFDRNRGGANDPFRDRDQFWRR